MIERPDADALMAGPLGEWLTSQNDERASVKAKVRRLRWLAVAAGIAIFVVLSLVWDAEAGIKLGAVAGFGGFGLAELAKRPLLNKLKGGINGAIAKALELQYSVEVAPGETFARAETFEMVPSYDDSGFSDLWWGVVGGRPFTLHEARLTEQRGSGKSRRTVVVFEGSIMSIGFNRRFHATTLLEPDNRRRKWLVGSEKESCTIGGVELERADMVDPRFEDRFTVWSNDQVEARYLVHPEYLERLLAVEAAFAGQDIRALFHGGDLLIALQTGDLFESGSLDAEDDRNLLAKAIEQFGALADLAVALQERERASFGNPGQSNT